jgi:uncharacterized protein (DUF1330 family)
MLPCYFGAVNLWGCSKYRGRYLTKGGSHKTPEGAHWQAERVVIIVEFPDNGCLQCLLQCA